MFSGTKKFFKSLSWEVFINYLASVVEKLFQIIKDKLPTVISTIVTLLISLYAIIAKFTGKTFIVTGGQLLIILGIVIIFALTVKFAPTIRKRQIAKSEEFVIIFELDWKIQNNLLIGPYCPHCSKEILTKDMIVEDIRQVLDDMFGEQLQYIYKCARCSQSITLDGPIDDMKIEAHKKIFFSP